MEPFRRSLWLLDLLSREELSRLEISDRWERSSLNDKREPYGRRTFNRDKEYIENTFRIEIRYNSSADTYMIANPEMLEKQGLLRYSMEQNRLFGLEKLSLRLQGKIYLEPINTGSEHLPLLLEAIDQGVTVRISYVSFYEPDVLKHFELIPCFVRLFERRWYLIGEFPNHTQHRILALERMRDVTLTTAKKQPSERMSPDLFFKDCYGIIYDDQKPTWITLKVYRQQVNYVRTVPIHSSQEEIETHEGYSLFRIFVRPSYDLVQHLLWHRDEIEVIAPLPFREGIKNLLENMLANYKPNANEG